MPILSPKRQITLPKELCDRLVVEPGDDLLFLEHQGRNTIIKKVKGSSKGVAKHLKANGHFSDEEALRAHLDKKQTSHPSPKHAA